MARSVGVVVSPPPVFLLLTARVFWNDGGGRWVRERRGEMVEGKGAPGLARCAQSRKKLLMLKASCHKPAAVDPKFDAPAEGMPRRATLT